MAKNISRAVRRSHRARLIKKYMNYEMFRWDAFEEDSEENRLYRATHNVNHIKACSCQMCCNPRRSTWTSGKERYTMQERKENDRFEYEQQEVLGINTVYGKEHRTDC